MTLHFAPFDQAWINRVETHIKKQVERVQKHLAANALNYFCNFCYHALSRNRAYLGYSYWYATHWRVWADAPQIDGTSEERRNYDEVPFAYGNSISMIIPPGKDKHGHFNGDAPSSIVPRGAVKFGGKTFVTNSVGYGPWLNYGGWFGGTFVTDIMKRPAFPLHFLEKNIDGMKRTVHLTIKRIWMRNQRI